jgi:alpha-glucosidase
VERHASRWRLTGPQVRLYLAVLLSLRGSVCLYQGEELGLPEAYVPFEDLRDPYGIRFWPKFRGRDGCRTPMPWTSDMTFAGFSDSKPWLPIAVDHKALAVDAQDSDPGSVLAFYRRMLAFRGRHPALAKGSLTLGPTASEYVSFTRSFGDETLFCAFNLSDTGQTVTLPEGSWHILSDAGFESHVAGREGYMPPAQALFAVRRDA